MYTKTCMKIAGKLLGWTIVMLVTVNLVFGGSTYFHDMHFKSLAHIVSPIPQILTNAFANQKNEGIFWTPHIPDGASIDTLPLSAKSVISYDISTNTLLYAKNIDQKLPIASLTKIMTAIVALENMNLTDKIIVSQKASSIGEDSVGLSAGEKFTLDELLYGLILKSGNDAAEAIAQGSQFGRADFLHLMNKKAEDLGLTNTRFTNPTGLQGDGNQYSTAKELLVITHYALEKAEFAKVAATYEYDIDQTPDHKAYTLYNETNLLTTYPGVKGVKTGYTDEAGLCLVTYLEYKDHKIIAILLNSTNRRAEMTELLDYSLKSLGITPPFHG